MTNLYRPSTEFIYVDVGLNCFIQFTLDEAVKFIEKKIVQLSKQVEELTKRAAAIRSNIKLVYESMNALINQK